MVFLSSLWIYIKVNVLLNYSVDKYKAEWFYPSIKKSATRDYVIDDNYDNNMYIIGDNTIVWGIYLAIFNGKFPTRKNEDDNYSIIYCSPLY